MLEEIKDVVRKETLVVSISAGKTIAFLEEGLSAGNKIIRCMPNTPALVGEGCTGVCCNKQVSVEEFEGVLELLSSFGKAYKITESMMDAVVAVSGSSPA